MKASRILVLVFAALVMCAQANAFFKSTKIKSDEYVIFFPALAYLSKDKTEWIVDIHGWIFESNLAASVKSVASKLLGIGKDTDKKEFKKLMKQRVHWFFVDNERNKQLTIKIQNQSYTLNKSKPNGHFYKQIRLKTLDVNTWNLDQLNRISFKAVTRKKDPREFKGYIQFVPETGLSIISDVDDTIKLSEVHDKKLLLRNTFMRPYRTIPGMAKTYQRWALKSKKNKKIVFHYLTASPWQLYVPLSSFLKKNNFPFGSFHMKYFRIKDSSFFNVFNSSVEFKSKEILSLMNKYPKRQFILVGDSGENDFEIYTKIASKHKKRIRAIFIHEVKPKPIEKERYKTKTVKSVTCPIVVFKTQNKPADLKLY